MSESVPADVPLGSQHEGPDTAATSDGERDEHGEDLDERGLAAELTPANPASPDS